MSIILKYFTSMAVLILFLHLKFLVATECPTESDKKCEEFWHELFKYPGHNLKEGLKCLKYNPNKSSMQDLGHKSLPQRIHFVNQSVAITEIDEIKGHIRWEWKYKMIWLDKRLKWPEECHFEGRTITDFVKSELLEVLWNPVEFLKDSDEASGELICQKILQITQVIQ